MNEALAKLLAMVQLRRFAAVAGGIEAAAFELGPGSKPQLIAHIPPGFPLHNDKELATEAFAKAIERCLSEDRDNAVETSGQNMAGQSFFCLVLLLRPVGNHIKPAIGALATIVACKGAEIARERLILAKQKI